jgi:hypothetical protein
MSFPRNWEFGSALSKLQNNFGGFEPPARYASEGNCESIAVTLSEWKIGVFHKSGCYRSHMDMLICRGKCAFFIHGCTAPVGLEFLIVAVPRARLDSPPSVGLPWTSDRPVAETSTWQQTTLTRDRHPCPLRGSNPLSEKASGRRPTPETARSLGLALLHL